jgi:hypothetical protein
MAWWDYVQKHARGDSANLIAKKIDMIPSSVSRWKTVPPKAENVVAFARKYDRPPVEALVAAGYLTQQEANLAPPSADLADASNDELLGEVKQRMR